MPMSTDIRLPKEQEPVFPPLCCRCLAADPEHKVRFSASRFSWSQLFFVWIWLFRKSVKHEVPLCDACRGPARWRKSLEVLVLVAVVVLALTFVVPWIKSIGLNRQWQKIATYGGAFVFAIPYILWCVFRPPAFDMTVGDEHVEYEFADEDYAMQFAAFNPGAESDDIYLDGDDDDDFEDEPNGDHVDDGQRR